MIERKNNTALFIVSLVLGIVYLLSALGKYSGLESFESTVSKFGFHRFFAYIIIGIESVLCICFLLQFFIRQAALISIIFLAALTFLYAYGHFLLSIESCDCFGDIDFLNTSDFTLFLFKNILLISFSIYLFYKSGTFSSGWLNKIIAVSIACAIVFGSIKYNTFYLENFPKRNIRKSISELGLKSPDSDLQKQGIMFNYDYYFIFSPNCQHCRKAIPLINSMIEKHQINLIGIIADRMKTQLVDLKSETTIEFDIITVDDKVFKNLVKMVPVIYEVSDQIVTNTYLPKWLPVNILSKNKINLATHRHLNY